MSKFTKAPVINADFKNQVNKIQEFVKGASQKPDHPINTNTMPWENLDDTEKTKGISLRLTKTDLVKLQYISRNTPYSIQAFCYEQIKRAIAEQLEHLNIK